MTIQIFTFTDKYGCEIVDCGYDLMTDKVVVLPNLRISNFDVEWCEELSSWVLKEEYVQK